MALELRKCTIKGKKKPEVVSHSLDSDVEPHHYGLYRREEDGSLTWCSDYDLQGKQITDPYHWSRA